jgi:hypothetical protein
VVRLLARAALRVDRRAGDAVVLAARQPGVAGHVVRLLAGLRDAPADDLLDGGGIDAGSLDDRLLHAGEQMRWVERAQGSLLGLTLADRGPQGLDDDCLSHAHSFTPGRGSCRSSARRRRRSPARGRSSSVG